MAKLPEQWVKEQATGGLTLFAVPVEDLSREELIAAVYFLQRQVDSTRAEHRSTLSMWRTLRQARQ